MPIIRTITTQEFKDDQLVSAEVESTMTFNFSELSDDAKEIAINRYSNSEKNVPNYGWDDLEHSDFAERLNDIGINVNERTIRSLVGGKGGGAVFEGTFNTDMERPNSKKLKERYGTDADMLLGYFDEMQNIASIAGKNSFILGKISMEPNNSTNSGCMDVEARAYIRTGECIKELQDEDYDYLNFGSELLVIFRTLANILYEKLCQRYHELTSDEAIMEKLSNDHSVRFLENGELYQEA